MSKRKLLVLVAIGFVLLANLPTREAPRVIDASPVDVVSGNATAGCISKDFVAWSGTTAGYSRFIPQLRLRTEGGAQAVYARWEASNGALGDWAVWSSAGSQLDITMTVGPPPTYATWHVPPALDIRLAPNSSFTAKLVFRTVQYNPGSGCYRVTNVGITRVPQVTGGGGGTTPPPGGGGYSPSPSPTPTPTGAPTPTPEPTSPACSATVPLPSGCVPPDGYCWMIGPQPSPVGPWPIVKCDAQPTPSPTPTPPPNCDVWEAYTVTDPSLGELSGFISKRCSWSGSGADGADVGPGNPMPALPTISTGAGAGRSLYARISTGVTCPAGCPGYWLGIINKNGGSYVTYGGWSNDKPNVVLNPGGGAFSIGDVIRAKGRCGFGACNAGIPVSTGYAAGTGGESWYWFPSLTGGLEPWNASPTPGATPTPSPSPSGASPTPSFFNPSPDPNPDPGGGGGGGAEVCAPGSYSEVLCSPDPAYSFNPATADPDGLDGLMLHLQSKAPFGYVTQVVDALGDAAGSAPGGAGPGGGTFGCFNLPRWAPASAGGAQSSEVCIPLQDMANLASPIRPALVAMLLVLIGVAFLRWVNSSTGGGQ